MTMHKKPLGTEETDSLIRRLYEDLPRAHRARHEKSVQEALERQRPGAGRRDAPLSADDAQALVQRLYAQSVESHSERMDALKSKYMPPKTEEELEKIQRPAQEIADSVSRLFYQATQKHRELSEKLSKTLMPEPSWEQMDKAAQLVHVKRLHDEEQEKRRKINNELSEKYLKPSDGKFSGHHKLDAASMAAMATRLSSKKSA